MDFKFGAQVNLSIIGFVESCYKDKFGTPRQPGLVPLAQGKIWIDPKWQPEISLNGLQGFSYIWVIFLFHQNTNTRFHAKVHPPKLGGDSIGVFATRSPHRPNSIGLSLLKLESVEKDHLLVSGLDLVDGTPVLDIKPFLSEIENPQMPDRPKSLAAEASNSRVVERTSEEGWVQSTTSVKPWKINWTKEALDGLSSWYQFQKSPQLKELIEQVISQDPRPLIYRGYEGQPDSPYRQTHALRLYEGDIHFQFLDNNEIEIIKILL